MRKLVLLIALIPSILHAECKIEGVNVIYRAVSEAKIQGRMATAIYKDSRTYIIEYSNLLSSFPKPLREHVLAHECAHHRLGHTQSRAYKSDAIESDADCDAIKQLGWNINNVNELISEWYKIYPQPYALERSESIKKCLYPN